MIVTLFHSKYRVKDAHVYNVWRQSRQGVTTGNRNPLGGAIQTRSSHYTCFCNVIRLFCGSKLNLN